MKRLVSLLSLVLLAAGCSDGPTVPDTPTPDFKKGGVPGKPPADDLIPLTVTFTDAATGVKSDAGVGGSATYTDGVDGVKAHITPAPYASFRLFAQYRSPRKICVNFGGQDLRQDVPFSNAEDVCADGYITTGDHSETEGFLGTGEFDTEMQVTWFLGDYNWFLRYGHGCDYFDPKEGRAVVSALVDGKRMQDADEGQTLDNGYRAVQYASPARAGSRTIGTTGGPGSARWRMDCQLA